MGFRKPLEKNVQKTCIEWLEFWGAVVVRTNSGAMKIGDRFIRFNSKKSCSDSLVCLPGDGRFLALEFKKPGRDTTDPMRSLEQLSFRQSVERAGGLGCKASSLEELKAFLLSHGYDTETRH